MQLALFSSVLLTSFAIPIFAQAPFSSTLGYDATYGDPTTSLNNVACSNGPNGLETKGYTTLGSLPNFPNVGASPTVAQWDDPHCGACYAVTYGNNTIKVLAVDASKNNFVVSPQAMDSLTAHQATQLGTVAVTVVEVNASECSLS